MNLRREIIVEDAVLHKKFFCDTAKCRGACCTLKGTLGAPVKDEEIEVIEEIIEEVSKDIPERSMEVILKRGFWEKSGRNKYINTVGGNECVFVYIEEGIAKCAFQKAYNEGRIKFKKPVSCELYPIRVSISGDTNILKYDYLKECEPALIKGIEEDTTVIEFVKEAVIREYGEKVYDKITDGKKN